MREDSKRYGFSLSEGAILQIAHECPDRYLDLIQEQIDAGANVNAPLLNSSENGYLLNRIIEDCNDSLKKGVDPKALFNIVSLFIKNGFDSNKDNGRQGAFCLATLKFASCYFVNPYLIDIARLLLSVGADPLLEITFYDEKTTALECIERARDIDFSYRTNMLYETLTRIFKAKLKHQDFSLLEHFSLCQGKKINRILAYTGQLTCDELNHWGFSVSTDTNYAFVFDCENRPLCFTPYLDAILDDGFKENKDWIDVSSYFPNWVGKRIELIQGILEVSDGYLTHLNIHFMGGTSTFIFQERFRDKNVRALRFVNDIKSYDNSMTSRRFCSIVVDPWERKSNE